MPVRLTELFLEAEGAATELILKRSGLAIMRRGTDEAGIFPGWDGDDEL